MSHKEACIAVTNELAPYEDLCGFSPWVFFCGVRSKELVTIIGTTLTSGGQLPSRLYVWFQGSEGCDGAGTRAGLKIDNNLGRILKKLDQNLPLRCQDSKMVEHRINRHHHSILACGGNRRIGPFIGTYKVQVFIWIGVVLYEYLGEEYPEVLGSILGALESIVQRIGIGEKIKNRDIWRLIKYQ